MRVRVAAMAVAVSMAVLGTACSKSDSSAVVNIITGPSQTVQVAGVSVTASNVGITLNACPAVVTFTAVATGTNVTQTFIWSHTGGGRFSSSGNSASIEIERDGVYTATATSTQDSSASDTATITATGACRGTPPSGGPNIHFVGHPLKINRGELSRLEWDITNAIFCKGEGMWSGQRTFKGTMDVRPQESGNYHMNCDGIYKTVYIEVIQPTPPPPPTPPTPPGGGGGGGGTPTPTPPTPPVPGPITVSINPSSFTQPAGVTQQFQATCHQNGAQIPCGSAPYWFGDAGTVFTVTSTGFLRMVCAASGISGTLTARVSFSDQTVSGRATIICQ